MSNFLLIAIRRNNMVDLEIAEDADDPVLDK